MGLDRSKFKPAPVAAMKKLDGELGQRKGYSNFSKAGYHKIDDGDNKFRIYPAHPDSPDGVFWMPKSTAWLSVETELYDDKNEKTGQTEIRRRPVFTSDVHAPKEFAGKDLVKSYLDIAKKKFEEDYETEAEKKTANDLLYDFKEGIAPSSAWVMYADKYDEKGKKSLAILEIKNMIKKEMNKITSEMDSGDSPISVDPFTDPEDGISIIVKKVGKGLLTAYTVELESKKNGKFNMTFIPTVLTDEDLTEFMNFEPLWKKYRDSFSRRDFELQKEGLMRFDTQNEFGVFEDESFLAVLEELEELVEKYIPEKINQEKDSEDENFVKPESNVNKFFKEIPKVEKEEEIEEEEIEEEQEQEEEKIPEVAAKKEVAKTTLSTSDKLAELKKRLAQKK